MPDSVFNVEKVDRLLETITDFILGTKLTNAEMDFVINRLWMQIQSGRVAAMAAEILTKQDESRPSYIH